MPAGPPNKPTYLKIVKGTEKSHKRGAKPRNEPQPPRSTCEPPPHLSPRALECWSKLAPMLDRLGVLTTADELALGEACEAFADVVEARASLANPVEVQDAEGAFVTIAEGGALIYTARGREGWTLRPRPEVALLEAASGRFHRLLGNFGLNPSARAKISLAEPDATGSDGYFS